MSGPGVKTGQKPVQGPAPSPRPTAPTRPVGTPLGTPLPKPEPKPTSHLDTAHFKPGQAPHTDHDDLKAKVEAAKRAQAAQGHGEHPQADEHGGDDHAEPGEHGEGAHGHHPGQLAGEAGRSANHLSHGAQGMKSAAQEAQALKAAANEAQALKAAAQEAEALAAAAREAQTVQKAVNVVRDAARVAGVAEAGFEAAHDAAEAAQLVNGAEAATDAAAGAAKVAPKAPAGAPAKAAHAGPHGHAPSKLGKGLGVIGVAGGGIQVAVGINQIRDGQTGEGIKNVVVGGGFAGSGVAELTLATKVATKVAAPLAGGASVIEGGYDVYQGIKHGDGKKVALGGAKGIGGALLAASPFVAGSVVGAPVGVVMAIAGTTLIAGAAVVENFDTLKGWARSGAKAVGNVASKAWEGAKDLFSGW